MVKCQNCKTTLDYDMKSFNWKYGKMWFCCHSCATSWCIKQLIKKKEVEKK